MTDETGKYSRSHGISLKVLRNQAEKIGIPIVQKKTSWKDYEKNFKEAISEFKKEDIKIGIFGDIDLQQHRDWVERVCKNLKIKPILPLWKEEREKLLTEFIEEGFKAIVVSINSKFLDKMYLGREIDREFIKDLKFFKNIDLCGENGEYHTFVYNGPIFKEPVNFTCGNKILKENHWFLEIRLKEKNKDEGILQRRRRYT